MKCTVNKNKINLLNTRQKNRIKKLRKVVNDWNNNQKINFAWRARPNCYKILMAEFLLQRTKARSAERVYKKLIKRCPSFKSAVSLRDKDLNEIFSSLGLKKRAKILKKLIKAIADNYGGNIPTNYNDLLKLPGVGDYTASAVLVFGLNEIDGLVDANTIKIFSKIFSLKLTRDQGKRSRFIKSCAKYYSSLGDPRIDNWRLLDYAMNCPSL